MADEPPANPPKQAAEPAQAEPAKPEPPAAEKPGADQPAADKPPGDKAAADKHNDEDYYELYQVFADTLDQVERNYVKPVSRRELMEAAIGGVLGKLDPVFQLHQSRRFGPVQEHGRKPVRRHRHPDHDRSRPAQNPQPAGRHARLSGRAAVGRQHLGDRGQVDRRHLASKRPSSGSRAKPAPASRMTVVARSAPASAKR